MSERTMERRRLAALPLDMLRRISIPRIHRAAVDQEHVVALSLFFVLALAFSWPLAQSFTTRLIGIAGNGDIFHSTWILWHYQQWAMGQDDLLSSSLLYAPRGISMLVDGVGPLSGFIGLPLWSWGPVATYNGTVLIGLWLSGYCMFLLARSLKLAPTVALFAGIFFQLAPIHEVALLGHLEKTFTGLLPLTLLAINKTLNPRAGRWWSAATGLTLLLTGLYSGYQFVFAVLGVGFFALAGMLLARPVDRVAVIRRLVLASFITMILVVPLVWSILHAESDPLIKAGIDVSSAASYFSPDLIQFFLPNFYSAALGRLFYDLTPGANFPVDSFIGNLHRSPSWVGFSTETAVAITWTGLVLGLVAIKCESGHPRRWLMFALLCTVLALGPVPRFLGQTGFTLLGLPVSLPFALLSDIPGLNFMRAPGRMMMIGSVGWGITAGFGLDWLKHRLPRYQYWVAAGAVALLLIEGFPSPWPSGPLPQVPNFYKQLAQDPAHYAVLDLPVAEGLDYPNRASAYQMYQLTHHKAIAWGYLSHAYTRNPLTSLEDLADRADLFLDGRASDFGALYDLSRSGYRYVVWHKTIPDVKEKLQDLRTTRGMINALFGSPAKPFYEDAQVRVYEVPADVSAESANTAIAYGENWQLQDAISRWARSPATLVVNSPQAQRAELQIFPGVMFEPSSPDNVGTGGVLDIQVGDTPPISVKVGTGQLTTVPITLVAGKQTITLSSEAGNFLLPGYSTPAGQRLSFSIVNINLQISPQH